MDGRGGGAPPIIVITGAPVIATLSALSPTLTRFTFFTSMPIAPRSCSQRSQSFSGRQDSALLVAYSASTMPSVMYCRWEEIQPIARHTVPN